MAEGARGPEAADRMVTGIPGLDVVLNGGLLRGGTYIVLGPPGAGKTILGNQVAFHDVASGGRAIYVTLLAESHSRMLSHLRSLQFFDPSPIAASLTYVSGYRTLEQDGLPGLLDLLRKQMREQKATMLVLDGLVSAESFAPTELGFKKFIHELTTLVSFLGCTALVLTNGSARQTHPEHTMVDGLIELHDPPLGLVAARELVVRKFRGSSHLRGRHAFEITDAGLIVYPRTEALLPSAAPPTARQGSDAFGVAGLDAMLGGGLAPASTTLLVGPPGSGKTTLGLQFLAEGAKKKQPGLHFGFHEPPARLVAKADGFGLGFSELVRRGTIEIACQRAAELICDALAAQLLGSVRRGGVRRVFVDGLEGLRRATPYPERIPRFFAALTQELRALGATTIFSVESVEGEPALPVCGISAIAENLVTLAQVDRDGVLRRVVSIPKTRDRDHAHELREFRIGASGIAISSRPAGPVKKPRRRPERG